MFFSYRLSPQPTIMFCPIVLLGTMIFIIKENDKDQNGKWVFPKSQIHTGETFQDCSQRILNDMFEIDVSNTEFVSISNEISSNKKNHIIYIYAYCNYIDGTIQNHVFSQYDEWKWTEISNLENENVGICIKNFLSNKKNNTNLLLNFI